jgi:hypothetical protein
LRPRLIRRRGFDVRRDDLLKRAEVVIRRSPPPAAAWPA